MVVMSSVRLSLGGHVWGLLLYVLSVVGMVSSSEMNDVMTVIKSLAMDVTSFANPRKVGCALDNLHFALLNAVMVNAMVQSVVMMVGSSPEMVVT